MGEDRISPDMERYPVQQAAEMLGISEGALRNRLHRGTLQSVKEGGTVYVLLSRRDTADKPRDAKRDAGEIPEGAERLIAELQDRVRSLEEANRENRRIIAMLASRVPELEAPSEAPGSPETSTEGAEGVQPREAAREGARPWWRRIFGA